MEPDVLYETGAGVARICVNRPQVLNALRTRTVEQLAEAMRRADGDKAAGVVVLTGAGDRAFCAGGDVEEMRELTPETGRRFLDAFAEAVLAIRSCGKPVIARVRGHCVGGGNELQLACDLTAASDESTFGQVGPMVGSAPVLGGTQLLPRLCGDKRAREAMFLCPRYKAHEARELGWINVVVPAAELDATVDAWCRRILQMSPTALRVIKQAMLGEGWLEPALRAGVALLAPLYGSDELREGMGAFLEKRPARFDKFR